MFFFFWDILIISSFYNPLYGFCDNICYRLLKLVFLDLPTTIIVLTGRPISKLTKHRHSEQLFLDVSKDVDNCSIKR